MLAILDGVAAPVPGETISQALNISRSAVWKHIRELESYGYIIAASRQEGYQITGRTSLVLPYEIRRHWQPGTMPWSLFWSEHQDSTISEARRLLASAGPAACERTLIVTEEQGAGRGRNGREWSSPPGGIWISLILCPKIPMDRLFLVTCASSVALAETLREVCDLSAEIKWPNDLLINGKKVSGTLVEIAAEPDRINSCILGVGINANCELANLPDTSAWQPTTLAAETGAPVDRAGIVADFLQRFVQWFTLAETGEAETLLEEWNQHLALLGAKIGVHSPGETVEGTMLGTAPNGALIVQTPEGSIREVLTGSLELRK